MPRGRSQVADLGHGVRSAESYREKDQDVVIFILQHNVALSERDASLSSSTWVVDQTPQTKSTYKTTV